MKTIAVFSSRGGTPIFAAQLAWRAAPAAVLASAMLMLLYHGAPYRHHAGSPAWSGTAAGAQLRAPFHAPHPSTTTSTSTSTTTTTVGRASGAPRPVA